MIEYRGYHCGCCGDWIDDRFFYPSYRSAGEQADTVGICPECRTEGKDQSWQEIVGWD